MITSRKIVAGLLAAVTVLLPSAALAEIIQSTTDETNNYNWGACNRLPTAVSFTPSISGTISSSTNLYAPNNFPSHVHTDDIIIRIQTDNAGEPSGTDLATETLVPLDGNTKKYLTVAWSPTVSVSASTKYWYVFDRTGSCSGASYFDNYGSTDPNIAGFDSLRYEAGWTDEGNGTPKFIVEVVAAAAASPRKANIIFWGDW